MYKEYTGVARVQGYFRQDGSKSWGLQLEPYYDYDQILDQVSHQLDAHASLPGVASEARIAAQLLLLNDLDKFVLTADRPLISFSRSEQVINEVLGQAKGMLYRAWLDVQRFKRRAGIGKDGALKKGFGKPRH